MKNLLKFIREVMRACADQGHEEEETYTCEVKNAESGKK